ncbi:MAG: pirin family protein [Prevotellaceae bacterium]|nr:pirin family protein [Prevotellaceae bacterium]
MLDAFDSHNPENYIKRLPWHSHRSIKTVNYLVHGRIDHRNGLGNRGSYIR